MSTKIQDLILGLEQMNEDEGEESIFRLLGDYAKEQQLILTEKENQS